MNNASRIDFVETLHDRLDRVAAQGNIFQTDAAA